MTTAEYINELEKRLAFERRTDESEAVAKRAEEATQRAKLEQQRAEAATAQAKRTLSEVEAEILAARREIEHAAEQKSNLIDEGTVRAQEQLKVVKADLDKARQNAAQQRKELLREITDKTATVEQLNKAIQTAQETRRAAEAAAKSIEDEGIRNNERINKDRQALEREVGNLEAQKLMLNSEI